MKTTEGISLSASEQGGGSRLRLASLILDVVATGSILVVASAVWLASVHQGSSASSNPVANVPNISTSLAGAKLRGSGGAQVVMVEYADFECQFCGRFARDTLPTLVHEYVDSGQVLVAFRQMPLGIHSRAERAATTAECAARRGLFWQMHDLLFANQTDLTDASFDRYAATIGLSSTEFRACIDRGAKEELRIDAESGDVFKITGTPVFLFGAKVGVSQATITKMIQGARPVEQFRNTLNQLLAARVEH